MPKIPAPAFKKLKDRINLITDGRSGWIPVWQEVSDYFLPRRYPWLYILPHGSAGGAHPLVPNSGRRVAQIRNNKILDSTSTLALRTLSTGMMNGITSPARPWFRLTLKNKKFEEPSHPVNVWLEKATKEMHKAMAKTNFYQSLGILYQEWCAFGTASMGIYEDRLAVFRCKNFPIGGFFIGVGEDGRVDTHGRTFTMTLEQVLEKWPDAELPMALREKAKERDNITSMTHPVTVHHLVQPNKDKSYPGVRNSAAFREIYLVENSEDLILQARGLDEFPHVIPRWEVYADDVYGTSPCMEAIPDVIQLQHLTRRKAQGLDKTVDPPMLAHASLATKPKAFIPGGVTYVSTADLQQGARPTYQVQVPFDQLEIDKRTMQDRIREVLFNDLFRMISDLDTVRSASEIDARREEKLVLLGPVLERFQSEGLAPSIERIFAIMLRGDLLPPAPPELEDEEIDVDYTGILSDAQRAVGTIAVERWLAMVGNTAQMAPDVIQIPDWEEVIRYYADAIGVPPQLLKEPQESAENAAAVNELAQLEQTTGIATQLASGAKQLSETDVGGGQNALQAMMGGAM